MTKRSSLERFAWLYLAYLFAVILFGAWVRISGSGNGCGNHWPVCNGEILPTAPSVKTVIEFTHRLTSGLSGIFGLVLLGWAWQQRAVHRWLFRASLAALVFLLLEAFIGAVLVKKELVANDASASRALVVALHLVNTMLLTATTASVAWFARGQQAAPAVRMAGGVWLVVIAAFVVTNMTGAVTALGDTLFPVQPALNGDLWARLRDDLSPTQHFLVRLRMIHPLVAATTAFGTAALLLRLLLRGGGWLAQVGLGLVATQVCLGLLNVALAAPPWMQIVHLLVSQCLWVVLWLGVLSFWFHFRYHQPSH
ncbi:MAG: COX15/CtaA family protein [Bryobacteraceae bacterium]|nr:COX15/CtaA family protein [Bryobacteraceae bacterium]